MNSPDDAVFAERLSVFLQSLSGCADADLQELAAEARERGIPVIRPETAQFLRVIVKMKRPQRILEVGTAVGLSALVMSRCMDPEGEIVTIERDAALAETAKAFLQRAGENYAARVTLLVGEAENLLPTLSGEFDFVFIDAAKSRYPDFWLGVQSLLAPRAVVGDEGACRLTLRAHGGHGERRPAQAVVVLHGEQRVGALGIEHHGRADEVARGVLRTDGAGQCQE